MECRQDAADTERLGCRLAAHSLVPDHEVVQAPPHRLVQEGDRGHSIGKVS